MYIYILLCIYMYVYPTFHTVMAYFVTCQLDINVYTINMYIYICIPYVPQTMSFTETKP